MILPLLFLLSLGLSYVLNSVLINFAGRLGQLSQGNTTQIRWASSSKPLVGGISFFILFLVGAVIYTLIPWGEDVKETADYIPLLLSITVAFLVGLADDAYTTKPILKFIGQFMCGIILISFGVRIELFNIVALDSMLTMIWVIGLMNSVNMLDNMDGITGTTAFVALGFTLVALYFTNQASGPFFYLIMALEGALAGFLILNWNPSKLYMGDTGSQFLGMLLAFVGIKYFWNIDAGAGEWALSKQILAPILVFLMPIMDTTFVSIARLRRGQSPFVGGRDHTTHHLSYLGVPDKHVPLITGSIGLTGGILMLSMFIIDQWQPIYTFLYAGFILAVFGLFVYLYNKGARLGRLKAVRKERAIIRESYPPTRVKEAVPAPMGS